MTDLVESLIVPVVMAAVVAGVAIAVFNAMVGRR